VITLIAFHSRANFCKSSCTSVCGEVGVSRQDELQVSEVLVSSPAVGLLLIRIHFRNIGSYRSGIILADVSPANCSSRWHTSWSHCTCACLCVSLLYSWWGPLGYHILTEFTSCQVVNYRKRKKIIYQDNEYSKNEGSVLGRVNYPCIYFRLKMVVRPKHAADKE
jgi:hypothetical protein